MLFAVGGGQYILTLLRVIYIILTLSRIFFTKNSVLNFLNFELHKLLLSWAGHYVKITTHAILHYVI